MRDRLFCVGSLEGSERKSDDPQFQRLVLTLIMDMTEKQMKTKNALLMIQSSNNKVFGLILIANDEKTQFDSKTMRTMHTMILSSLLNHIMKTHLVQKILKSH